MNKVLFLGEQCSVVKTSYATGGVALQLRCEDGEPMCTATVNIQHVVPDGHVLIKDWSENQGVLAALIEAGIVEDTGKTVTTGFVTANMVRLLV
jgi:hypothetical protein